MSPHHTGHPLKDALMSINAAPVTVNVPVRTFLEGVFGADWRNAWVCAVPSADSPDWTGASASKAQLDGPGWASMNCYYSVAVMKPGATSRQDVNWARTHVIVIDDVDEKADAGSIFDCLGDPSFVVQTSLGSQQWGYILRQPIADAALQARLMRAITLAFFKGIEPGHRDLTRYVRLPVGINNKTSRVIANGGTAPVVVCTEWQPSRTYDWRDLAGALDMEPSALNPSVSAWADAEGTKVISGTASGVMGRYAHVPMSDVDAWIAKGDYILAAFREANMLRGEQANGYLEVECPWDATHTKIDDRAGWSPERFLGNSKGFKCHHSDGVGPEGRSDLEVEEELTARLPAGRLDTLRNVAFQGRKAKGASLFANNPPSAGQAGMLVVQTAVATATGTAAPAEWEDFITDQPGYVFPARKSVCSFLTRGDVTLLAAQPGTGKSFLAVATAAALATDTPQNIGDMIFARNGSVIYVSNEDDASTVRKRRKAWMDHHKVPQTAIIHHPVVNRMKGLTVLARANRNDPITTTAHLASIEERIDTERAAGRDVAAVFLDTATTVFDGIEENDAIAQGRAYGLLGAWAERMNVSVMVVCHMPKSLGRAGGGGDQASVRGSGASVGAAREVYTLVHLCDEDKDRLQDQSQRDQWVIMECAKANNKKRSAFKPRWFFLNEAPIAVVDENGATGTDMVGVMELRTDRPDFGFDPASKEGLYAITALVCDMLNAGVPVRVRVTGTDLLKPSDLLADRLGWTREHAAKGLRAALKEGMIEEGDGPLNSNNNRPQVYRPTKTGADMVEKGRVGVSDMDVSEDDDYPI